MAKTTDSNPSKPAPAAASSKLYTEEDMKRALLLERYVAWHTVSKMRSNMYGDAPGWIAAADEVLAILLSPPAAPKGAPVKEELFEEQSGTETEAEDEE